MGVRVRSVCVVNMIMRMVMVFVKVLVVLVVSMSAWMRVGVRMRMRGSVLTDAFVEHEGAEGHNRETGDGGENRGEFLRHDEAKEKQSDQPQRENRYGMREGDHCTQKRG